MKGRSLVSRKTHCEKHISLNRFVSTETVGKFKAYDIIDMSQKKIHTDGMISTQNADHVTSCVHK